LSIAGRIQDRLGIPPCFILATTSSRLFWLLEALSVGFGVLIMLYRISERVEDEYGSDGYSMADSMEPIGLACLIALLMVLAFAGF
jgi:hypothetical protein